MNMVPARGFANALTSRARSNHGQGRRLQYLGPGLQHVGIIGCIWPREKQKMHLCHELHDIWSI
jgi:hypothetical protein